MGRLGQMSCKLRKDFFWIMAHSFALYGARVGPEAPLPCQWFSEFAHAAQSRPPRCDRRSGRQQGRLYSGQKSFQPCEIFSSVASKFASCPTFEEAQLRHLCRFEYVTHTPLRTTPPDEKGGSQRKIFQCLRKNFDFSKTYLRMLSRGRVIAPLPVGEGPCCPTGSARGARVPLSIPFGPCSPTGIGA